MYLKFCKQKIRENFVLPNRDFLSSQGNQAKILEDFVMRSKFDPTATSQALFAPPSSEITGAA